MSKAVGLYAPSQEADRWRQIKALDVLFKNEELRRQIAENGYNYVRSNLTWEKISEQKDKIVQEVLNKREKGSHQKRNGNINIISAKSGKDI